MARRPVFVPSKEFPPGVNALDVEFEWFPGLSRIQKQRSIHSLHNAAAGQYELRSILEISSRSEIQSGRELSAFNLCLETGSHGRISVEAAFQGSKVFQRGGPYTDLYRVSARQAKQDMRLRESGELTAFRSSGRDWPLEPKTLFYDWLYLSALKWNPRLAAVLLDYDAFTDIEFNPKRSFSCQARSAGLYVHLVTSGFLDQVMDSTCSFIAYMLKDGTGSSSSKATQLPLL